MLVAAAAILILSPVTVSSPVAVHEVVVVAVGVAVLLAFDLLLLRRSFAPLVRLTRTMRAVDPLRPGVRVPVDGDDADIAALTRAFNDMLERLEDERRDSARRALAAQEAERLRLARELHDEVGQALTGAVLQVERAVRNAAEGERSPLVDARESIRATLDEVKRISRRLRPEALDDFGLGAALNALALDAARRSGVDVERRIQLDLPPLTAEQELVIYRVAQESLTNALRHAGASTVRIALQADDAAVRLQVRDDGCGLRPGDEDSPHGIRGMRERALLVGGGLAIRSGAGSTEVLLDVPTLADVAP